MFNFVKWVEDKIDTATKQVAAKSELNGVLGGPFIKAYICADCASELTWDEKMGSLGCCPYCGHTVPGTVVETYEISKKKRKEEKATLREKWRYFKAMFMMW